MRYFYNKFKILIVIIIFAFSLLKNMNANDISAEHIPSNKDILINLHKNVTELSDVYKLIEEENYDSATILLAKYYKNKFTPNLILIFTRM